MSEEMLQLITELERQMQLAENEYRALLTRYDDLNKRCHDMQAELEYLRREVNRG